MHHDSVVWCCNGCTLWAQSLWTTVRIPMTHILPAEA